MTAPTPQATKQNYFTASYTLPGAYIKRIERMARKAQANRSTIVRQILAAHFAHLDAQSPAPVPAAPAAPAPQIAEVPAGSPVDGESLPQIAS